MFASIPEILDELRAGRFVVLVDDEDRENEGDLVLAAEFATPENIHLMQRLAGGYLCLSLTEADCERLSLPPQAADNTSVRGTPFTVSIDAHPRHGVSTGVSAFDRAKTVALAIDPGSTPADFVRPGHINPLRSRDGGVLVRTGQTEGSVDLCRLAGLRPAALIIEIVRADGRMARRPDLERLCGEHGWKMCSVEQLIAHRLQTDSLVERLEPARGTLLRTALGEFNLIAFRSVVDPLPHVALTVGGVGDLDERGRVRRGEEPTLVRMHRRNLLGDVFLDAGSSPEGPTAWSLHASMRAIQRAGRGAVVYLRTHGQDDDSLEHRLQMPFQRAGSESFTAAGLRMDLREYGIGGQILRALGLSRLRLLSNHPRALPGLEAFGLEIVEHVSVSSGE
ncbi:MAG: 3,4-dihydroxy-2-butanone-4-phosphate synthase [Planctomycetota bacterium]|nr:3,4-dihydroxy-2-butanone-4-phosphate synthase [Planctomycetota bacterium]